jgi:FixJ family two-component response regulator
MSDDVMLEEFQIEAAEMFEEAEQGLLSIDRGDDFFDNYNSIFRAFHSLKGAAGMFGLEELQAHMHQLESFFESLKEESNLTKTEVDYFLDGIDASKKILAGESIEFTYISKKEDEQKEAAHIAADSYEPEEKAKKLEALEKKKESAGIVYIVDDEPDIVDILELMLEKHNYEVYKYHSAKELLSALAELKPDCILSDIKMPELDGIQMLTKVSEVAENVPVLFISAYITKDIMLKGLSAGAFGFVDKPFDETKVLPVVKNAVNRRRALKLLSRSIDYILYQFTDLDNYLKESGKESVRETLKKDIASILQQRKILLSVK